MKAPSISRRIWLVISTVAVIGGLFAFYFFVYMENRREDLEAKKFRTLEQYADNIKNAYEEATKQLLSNCNRGEANKKTSKSGVNCIGTDTLKQIRFEVIQSTIDQSDFSELLFEFKKQFERQTFRNALDERIIYSILGKEDAAIRRQVEFRVNNKDYVIFIHAFELKGEDARIFGFCDKGEFESQVRSVDLKYVVIATLFLIFTLLVMPLLKLWIMNESEKLHMMNVWFCGFSLVVGSSLLLLIILMANDFTETYESFCNGPVTEVCLCKDRNSRIKALSETVESSLVCELRKIYTQIKAMPPEARLTCGKETSGLIDSVLQLCPMQFEHYPYFNELLWIKKSGAQKLVMATHKLHETDTVNLSKRKYFSQALHQDSTWSMPDTDSNGERFALQSIHSYLTNRHEAGFGTPFGMDSVRVLAIATKLHSIMDPLLPPGYQFAFVDVNGKVWFHSTTAKNVNENFLNETGNDRKLIAAIQGRSETFLNVTYERSNHQAYIKPIRNTGLYLIVLHNDDFHNTPIILTVVFAFFLVFVLLMVQGLHQIILLLTTYRFSLLKVKTFFLTWLKPQREKARIYRNAMWIQLGLLLPTGLIGFFFHSLDFAVCFITLPVFLTVFHYFSLEHQRLVEEKKQRGRRLVLNPFLLASILMVVFINFSAYRFLPVDEFVRAFAVQFFYVLVLAVFYKETTSVLQSKIGRGVSSLSTKTFSLFWRVFKVIDIPIYRAIARLKKYENSYVAFLLLWLILASLLPTYYFYKVGYYEEGKVWMRYLQLVAARQQEARDIELRDELSENFGGLVGKMSDMGSYQATTGEINFTLSSKDTLEFDRAPRQVIHEMMFKNAPPLKGIAEESLAAIYPASGDAMWVSYEKSLYSTTKYITGQGESRYYQSSLRPYSSFKGDYWMMLLLAIVLGTLLLYRTLRFCIVHIFGLDLLIGERLKTPRLEEGVRFFVVGLPHSGKRQLVWRMRRIKKIEEKDIEEVDLSSQKTVTIALDCKLIIAKNFHIEINNHRSNEKKLKLMEEFKKYQHVPVIVISSVEPSAILDYYDKLADYYRDEKGDREIAGNYSKCRQAQRKWEAILGSYSIHYRSLREHNEFMDPYINAELNHGEYLPRLYRLLDTPIRSNLDREKMVLQVENHSRAYYQAIWSCLSSSEKFLLHDLARDQFVNMRNMKTIRDLRQKGLLVLKNSLQIMNMSFNNFILSIVQEDVDIKMEEQIRSKGSWNTIHLVLVITIVSLIAFLGIAQQDLFKNFQAILAATTALLPLLARFGGVFSGSKDKD